MTVDQKSAHFPALTGIRAVAVYLVYLHHTNPFSAQRFGDFIHRVVTEFHIGVSIFFVLSGFLITYRYYNPSSISLIRVIPYIKNRVARVYPMYFLVTTLTLAVFFVQGRQGSSPIFDYVMNITFLRGFLDDLKFTLVGQGWSLTVEECFYFSAPFLFLAFRKSKWAPLLLPILIIMGGCITVILFSQAAFYGFFDSYEFLFVYTFPGRCAEFFWGAGLALFLQSHGFQERKGQRFTWGGIVSIAALVILLSRVGQENTSGIFSAPGVIVNNFILPGAIAMLFYGLLSENTFLRKILSTKLFVLLGKSSYTFYLIHVGVFYQFVHVQMGSHFMVTFLLLNALAIALWHFVEEPLNRWIRGL